LPGIQRASRSGGVRRQRINADGRQDVVDDCLETRSPFGRVRTVNAAMEPDRIPRQVRYEAALANERGETEDCRLEIENQNSVADVADE
jgi:hypothetical protein